MIRKKNKRINQSRVFIKANHNIRVPQLRVLNDKGEMIGVMATFQALQKAREEDKDLVLVTEKADVPIAKIIELSKYKYQLKQKQAEGRKRARIQDTKEVRFTPFMGENDFQSKLKKVMAFLERGDKVKLTLIFKGRQNTKKEFGFDLFKKIFDQTQDISIVEIEPKVMGTKLQAQLSPVKKDKKNEKN